MFNKTREFKRGKRAGKNGQLYPFIDLANERFGRLVALRVCDKDNNRHLKWECVCDCGTIKNIAGTSLIQGYTMSCGCYHRETKSKNNRKHGKSNSKIYRVWRGMFTRCYGNEIKYEKNYKGEYSFVIDGVILIFFMKICHQHIKRGCLWIELTTTVTTAQKTVDGQHLLCRQIIGQRAGTIP